MTQAMPLMPSMPSTPSAQPTQPPPAGAPQGPVHNAMNVPHVPNIGNATGIPNIAQRTAFNPQALAAELFSQKSIKTMVASLGIGIVAMLVTNFITTLIFATIFSPSSEQKLIPEFLDTLPSFDAPTITTNPMSSFFVIMVLGLGGALHMNTSSSSASSSARYWPRWLSPMSC
ncbi:hypothetical protein KIH75_08080 [Bifidobacterium sp. 64T4]|uniref:hypothetical protein n=1 Tax=Bifidobacterium pongonis TaxID=2834432 RepID=UPI001C571B9D|nr:hypothetical protein [Bifidobacterium pongonis]MBW3095291.1 hypothetical protein [Bifidobacterium pongonis]